MCILCNGNDQNYASIDGKTITCSKLMKFENNSIGSVKFIDCPNLVSVKNIAVNYDMKLISCPKLEYVEVDAESIFIESCPELRIVRVYEMRIMYIEIHKCPLLSEFPTNGTIAVVDISNIWVSCLFNTYEDGFCSNKDHKHLRGCFPHYNKIVRIQRSIRKRNVIKTLNTPIIKVLWPIILGYLFG